MNDEITQKIYELRNAFILDNKGLITPNVVYFGHNQWYDFKNATYAMILDTSIHEYTIFGMIIKRVVENNYLAVGFVKAE